MPYAHSLEVKQTAITRVLTGQESPRHVALQMGIGISTLQRWVRQAGQAKGEGMAKQEKRPQDWTREQKLNALLETSSLSQEKLGAWCRQHGLHTHHLDQWRRELAQEPAASDKTSLKKAHQQNKKLKQELRRKDKALAETSALLVLKKKANAIWGESEDD